MKRMQEYDHIIKIIMIGESGVGKSSIFRRYCEKYYDDVSMTTIGVDYNVKIIDYHGKKLKLQIWDTAGQERYRTVTSTYYRGADAIILVFDLTNEYSFNKLEYWMTEMRNYVDHNNFILVGNKNDDTTHSYQTNVSDIDNFIAKHRIEYTTVSAKKNLGINDLFENKIPNIMGVDAKLASKLASKVDSKVAANSKKIFGARILRDHEITNQTGDCCQ